MDMIMIVLTAPKGLNHISYKPHQIGIKFSGMFLNESLLTIFCMENQMI
jgi:hypothetical protein